MKEIDLALKNEIHLNKFSTKISEALLYRNKLSTQRLGALIGRSVGTIFNWKNKGIIPGAGDIENIAEVLELDIMFFHDTSLNARDADLTIRKEIKESNQNLLQETVFKDAYGDIQKIADFILNEASDKELKLISDLVNALSKKEK